MSIRTTLLTLALPITKAIGKIHAPWTIKKTTASDFAMFMDCIQAGDVILSHTCGDLSAIVIPKFWSHAAIIGSGVSGVEAVSPKVRSFHYLDFFFKKDYVAILRPKFATKEQCFQAAIKAEEQLGKPYDYMLESSSKAFTCSELVQWCYAQVIPDVAFTKRKTLGELTVIPQDYWDATKKFDLVWTNYKGKR